MLDLGNRYIFFENNNFWFFILEFRKRLSFGILYFIVEGFCMVNIFNML